MGDQRALRDERWKLSWSGDQPAALYDLVEDPGEANDLARAQPDRLPWLGGWGADGVFGSL